MSAGRYRVPVVLQKPVETRPAGGSVTVTYQTIATAFASIRLIGQQERFSEERQTSGNTYEIRLRRRSGLTGGWRILTGFQEFRVLSAADGDQRRRELVCLTEEVTS
ncbi:head-tail adaptor protein [Roseibium denhamense]|uniref:Phage head-tail adaptor, putative, SPP1 family n=1 Tax=Roseibium denhamense TaxID=76305 RepID=A0ABY1PLN7_9HYPH|nr:phage head closure protein [Roseibium denhamense]MTI05709.1 head-tail adaptor protein [Roseibium denhamense]SMP36933.1 phage head-tail adaptor, putative, SPP1 family [Roseibium denhamense]